MPKIPTHDVRRKDTAAFCLMEFNETSTIYLTVLLKSYVKVSEEEIVFWSKDTAHDVSKVLFYWGYSGSFLVEGDPFDEEGEPSSSKTRKGAKFVPRSSFSLAARNGLRGWRERCCGGEAGLIRVARTESDVQSIESSAGDWRLAEVREVCKLQLAPRVISVCRT